MRAEVPLWTLILLAAIFLIFLFEMVVPLREFAFVPAQAFEKPWTFITSIFLHADFSHLFFNMFALFIFGLYLEPKVGRKTFLIIFILAGIAGNFGYMLTNSNPNIPGVGASGAIFGIIGALTAIAPLSLIFFGFAPMPMIVAAVLWGLTEFLGLFVPSNIARGAHLGGLFLGIAYGLYLRKTLSKT